MALSKIQSESMNLADTFAFTGTVSGAGDVASVDIWKLPSDHTGNAIITAWVRPSYTGASYVGTGMTHSSGIFTFPSTGLWKISLSFRTNLRSTDTSAGILLKLSTDGGSSTADIAGAFENRNSNSSCHTQALVNVTNTSNFQISCNATALDYQSASDQSKISGHADRNDTSILFERITDSQ